MDIADSRIVSQIAMTIINGLAVIGGIIILNGLIARSYGIDTLGEYLLMRRVAFALIPVSLYGVGIAIPRYLGIHRDRPELRLSILRHGLSIFGRFGLPTLMVLILGLYLVSLLTDSQTVLSRAALPIGLLGAGGSFHLLAYNYFRGLRLMAMANALQLVNIGLLPLAIILVLPGIPMMSMVAIHGLAVLVITLAALAGPLFQAIRLNPHTIDHSLRREISSYAFRRLGASWGMLALMSLGPIFIAYFATWEEVAFFSVGMQVNRLFYVVFGPIGIVLLPVLSYHALKGPSESVRLGIRALYMGGIAIGLYATCHLWFFAEPILTTWLGAATFTGVRIFRLFSLSLTGYLLFELSRNPIDAIAETGYNSRNILTGLVCIVAVAWVLIGLLNYSVWQGVTIGYVVGFWVLGLMSVVTCVKLYGFTWLEPRFFIEVAGLNVFILTILWMVIHFWVVDPSLMLIAVLELLAGSCYVLGLMWLNQEWLTMLRANGSIVTSDE